MSVEALVLQAALSLRLQGARVLVAVSGGVDSCVLAEVLHELSKRLQLELCIAHVNHGLRGEEAEADQAHVRALALRLSRPFLFQRVNPQALRAGAAGSRVRPTLQEAARRARYDALEAMAQEARAKRIATAHTLDDQAETLLLRLVRGAAPSGLGGIPGRSPDGRIVRPLLRVSRQAVEHWARERGLSWREDRSNRSPDYARGRFRLSGVRDWAQRENPNWLCALADFAEAQRRENAWVEEIVEQEALRRFVPEAAQPESAGAPCRAGAPAKAGAASAQPGPAPVSALRIDTAGFAALPEALALRLARSALRRVGLGREVSRTHLWRMVNFLRESRPGARLELPAGALLARRRADACRLQRGALARLDEQDERDKQGEQDRLDEPGEPDGGAGPERC